ncbi:succinate dehydrogenase/fumarate reductase flavoprotein subunit [Paraburkholderia sp. GAS199]|uniref:FAD-dependent oxidoreductase n=1 Tax=Paraburkholderia sp. GAS199 TaxID=3035126 RepID=UPI003D23C7D3
MNPSTQTDGASTSAAQQTFDVVVIGAGCGGMACALFAAMRGLSALVIERSQWVGGTTAFSAGALWAPNTHLADPTRDSRDNARQYLQAAAGNDVTPELREAFLQTAPLAIRSLTDNSDVQLRAFAYHPDYLSELPGSTTSGRVLEALPFDARTLGEKFSLVRPPIPEFTVLGGMMVDRIDIGHLLKMTRSFASLSHATKLVGRYLLDRLRYSRGTRLVMGNALVGRLLQSLIRRDVAIWTSTEVQTFIRSGERVEGVRVVRDGEVCEVRARCGVVLATGGFNDTPTLRQDLISPVVEYTPRSRTKGGLQQMALALGARMSEVPGASAFWAPVSVRKRADGSKAVFPHFVLDRAKPGTVVVNRRGRRFLNESTSYHLFARAMQDADDGVPAFLIADRNALIRYGLGMVRPGGHGLRRFLQEGYLVEANSLDALASRLAIDAAGLKQTVERMNGFAETGIDAEYARGTTAYERNLGDPAVTPNPTLGPILTGPFYAIRLYPADIGASAGLITDAHARVLKDGDPHTPIPGLYAAGNDMQSIMGAAYPGPGINLGPAVVFAYLAIEGMFANDARVPFSSDEGDEQRLRTAV